MNSIEIGDGYAIIHITGNKINGDVLIDIEDIDLVKERSWYIKDGSPNNYVACKLNNKTVKLHRFILGVTNRKDIVDHINRNTLDNRRCNLRIVDSTTNNLNCSISKNNTSGRTGVYYKEKHGNSTGGLWVAQCTVNFNKMCKRFSVKKYGYDEAFRLACETRKKWEEENNILTEKSSTTIETEDD